MATKKQTPNEWPLGDFLRKWRSEGRVKPLSARKAAEAAGISDGRWRQIENGYANITANTRVPVQPKPTTLAAMLRAIGAPMEEGFQLAGLRLSDYPNLANETAPAPASEPEYEWFKELSREDREKALAELQRLHMEIEVEAARRAG